MPTARQFDQIPPFPSGAGVRHCQHWRHHGGVDGRTASQLVASRRDGSGAQASVPRRSVAYLVRARSSASMRRLGGGLIPPLAAGETDERRGVDEWAAWRTTQIIRGQLKP